MRTIHATLSWSSTTPASCPRRSSSRTGSSACSDSAQNADSASASSVNSTMYQGPRSKYSKARRRSAEAGGPSSSRAAAIAARVRSTVSAPIASTRSARSGK
ncbi:Uncharacterised protein [Mycobacteroides abscessus]|nr:Uncharacterised protein [Mycobacteroides abscessus]